MSSSTYYYKKIKSIESEMLSIIENGNLNQIKHAFFTKCINDNFIYQKYSPKENYDEQNLLTFNTLSLNIHQILMSCIQPRPSSILQEKFKNKIEDILNIKNISPYNQVGEILKEFRNMKKELGYKNITVHHKRFQSELNNILIKLSWFKLGNEKLDFSSKIIDKTIKIPSSLHKFTKFKQGNQKFTEISNLKKEIIQNETPMNILSRTDLSSFYQILPKKRYGHFIFGSYLSSLNSDDINKNEIKNLFKKLTVGDLSFKDLNKQLRFETVKLYREAQYYYLHNKNEAVFAIDSSHSLNKPIQKILNKEGPGFITKIPVDPVRYLSLLNKELVNTFQVVNTLDEGNKELLELSLNNKWRELKGESINFIEPSLVTNIFN